jgi:DNA topoisomerase-2
MKTSKSAKNVPVETPNLGPQVDDYDQMDPRTHAYSRCGMYIGSNEALPRDTCVFDKKLNQIIFKNIDFAPGCERLFLEIISNSADNCVKSRKAGVECGQIETTMDNKRITVKNYGLPIPLGINPKTKKYVPEMIFGSMLSGSNLRDDVDRHGIGRNGIGAKAANIFSTKFEVNIENHIMKKQYHQIWENNMLVCHKPTIEPFTGPISSVCISYECEFSYFGYEEYPKEAFDLFRRHVADISFTSKVPVTFNEEQYNFSNYKDYIKLYFDSSSIDKAICHQQYNDKNELEVELFVFDTPDESHHITFANGMNTYEGGVHNDAVFKAIGSPLVKMINDKMNRKNNKLTDKEKKTHTITINDIKPHISILMSCYVINPDFSGQTKSFLTKPTPKILLTNDTLKPIYDWDLINRLYATLDAKQFSNLVKTDGKMCKFINPEKGFDCTNAGKYKRAECTLMLAEGNSALGYLKHYIANIPEGTSYYGYFPLKGKCLNTMRADEKRIAKNKEIIEIKRFLGLKEDVDYTDPDNFKKLRYGKVLIIADADIDAKHIIGLVINIFYSRFPSLLKIPGFLCYKRTPIVRVTRGKMMKKFYTEREYESWLNKTTNAEQYKSKYYKGLGTSTPEDVKDDLKDERIVTLVHDEDIDSAMNMAFNKDYKDQRKKWIMNWVERPDVDSMVNQPISLFINHEFILFSIANLKRALPKLFDGFKESYRKVICGAHKKFNIGALNKTYTEINLCSMDGYIKTELNYKHGADILTDVIVKMAQNFVGSNNINLFEPIGQFGTKIENGSDASAPRYLNTHPSKIFPYIFHIDDQPLLKYMIDENMVIEPEYYHQVIPLILVNGSKGISTGWSTFIPAHNPLEIINWLRARLNKATNLPILTPYYRGFEGSIAIIDRRTHGKRIKYKPVVDKELLEDIDDETILDNDDNVDEQSDDEELSEKNFKERPLLSYIVTGNYYIKNNGDIVITELPIGSCPAIYYKKKLVPLLESKKLKDVINDCDVDKIKFTLKGFAYNPSYKNLFLRKRYSLTNMILLDNNNKPVRYETANDIIETFYSNRIITYDERKKYKLNYIKNHIDKLTIQIRFIEAIKNKIININDTIENIYAKLDELKINRDIYDNARIKSLNKNETGALQNQINNYQKEYDELIKLTPADIWLNDLDQLETAYKKIYKQ